MGVYGALGGAQALSSFFLSIAFTFASLGASLTLFKAALNGVLRSPASFFDTIPMGKCYVSLHCSDSSEVIAFQGEFFLDYRKIKTYWTLN